MRNLIAVHGGAGLRSRTAITPERASRCTSILERVLRDAHQSLLTGTPALDAVCDAVCTLEDAPEFNAGRGSVFAHNGEIQMDASFMDGHAGHAGAVAGVQTVRHPILLARAVREHTPHVMLIGRGAESLAREVGLEIMSPEWFHVPQRWNQLQRALDRNVVSMDHDADPEQNTYGTVGAVAIDDQGHLAAATSTGGMVNKRDGRVGDTAVIGAGTWADQRVAISGTGHGEIFLKHHVASRIAGIVEFTGADLTSAAHQVVMEELSGLGAGGGVIAIDCDGHITMPFNTVGMFRGHIDAEGTPRVAIW